MRLAAIILCAFAACLLVAGAATGSWFKVSHGQSELAEGREWPSRFGLYDVEVCEDSGWALLGPDCRTVSYDQIGAADSESIVVMRLTLAMGVLACLYLIACAILVGVEVKADRGFATGAAVLSAGCLLAAIGVDVIRPRLLTQLDASVGSSFYLYVIGALAGLAGGICGVRMKATPPAHELPGDPRAHFPPELVAPPPPGAPRGAIPSPVPLPSPPVEPRPCTRCANPARWVPGYRRHYCDGCQLWI